MKQTLIFLFVSIIGLQIFSCAFFIKETKKVETNVVSVIPKPQMVRVGDGAFQITEKTIVLVPANDTEILGVAKYFTDRFKAAGELGGKVFKPAKEAIEQRSIKPISENVKRSTGRYEIELNEEQKKIQSSIDELKIEKTKQQKEKSIIEKSNH